MKWKIGDSFYDLKREKSKKWRGEINFQKREIKSDDDPTTLAHELIHGFQREFGFKIDENVTEFLAKKIVKFIGENYVNLVLFLATIGE